MGIDPGLKGFISLIDENKLPVLSIEMPLTKGVKSEIDLKTLFDILSINSNTIALAVLEKVGAMPKQGVVSMFRFGEGYGAIKMALAASKISYQLVTPRQWQGSMLAGENKQDLKSASIKVAKRLFPSVDMKRNDRCKVDDHNKADSLLMALYARRLYYGKE